MGYLRNAFRRVVGRLCRRAPAIVLGLAASAACAQEWAERLPSAAEPAVSGEQGDVDQGDVDQGYVDQVLGDRQDLDRGYPVLPRVSFDRTTSRTCPETWTDQVLPDGLLYKSYLAGVKEPRIASQWVYEREQGWIWDIALGGRVGIFRHGTQGPIHPEGWQLDLEGAGLPRLDFGDDMELTACDYRFGVPLTYARGNHQTKFGYYHLSSHLGDEYMLRHHDFERINYSRDSLVLGHSIYLTEDVRVYGEVAAAFATCSGAKPVELQFGAEYAPGLPTGPRPAPFIAVNGHLRQDVDFGGNVTVQSGLAWRGVTGHLFRIGMHCYVGMSDQYEFYDQYESKVGLGVWYDY
jgi:hypothetical protein